LEKAVSYFPWREVMQMGTKRWIHILWFLLCLSMVLWVMAYIAPKAC